MSIATGTIARPGLALRWRVFGAALPLLLLTVWAGALLAMGTATAGPRIGGAAPDFALADLDGNPLTLGELRGRPVIVNFWGSWCGPCVDEFPVLQQAITRHRGDDLVVVGIVVRDNSELARDFMARMGATWTSAMDPGGMTARSFGILGAPESFFIDRRGIVRGRQFGPLTTSDLERQLALTLNPATEAVQEQP
jgi:cytochrome c biogenesis protein CcmG/thiol:disulfide interchange protein DsbE